MDYHHFVTINRQNILLVLVLNKMELLTLILTIMIDLVFVLWVFFQMKAHQSIMNQITLSLKLAILLYLSEVISLRITVTDYMCTSK